MPSKGMASLAALAIVIQSYPTLEPAAFKLLASRLFKTAKTTIFEKPLLL
jgi:hypothetical protein